MCGVTPRIRAMRAKRRATIIATVAETPDPYLMWMPPDDVRT